MESRLRASYEQFTFLVEYMERHGDLSRPQPGLQRRLRSDQLWQDLAGLLNSAGGGVTKPAEKWKRVWSNWKTKTKKKASIINNVVQGTGGGPNRSKSLNSLEQRVLQIIGITSILGSQELVEAGFEVQIHSPVDDQLLELSPTPNVIPTSPVANIIPEPSPVPAVPVPGSSNRPVREVRSPRSPRMSTRASPRIGHIRRRRLRQTPFDRASSEFVAVEESRLRLEREMDARLHQRDMDRDARQHDLEKERLRIKLGRDRLQIDADRLEVERGLLAVAQQLTNQLVHLSSVLSAKINM